VPLRDRIYATISNCGRLKLLGSCYFRFCPPSIHSPWPSVELDSECRDDDRPALENKSTQVAIMQSKNLLRNLSFAFALAAMSGAAIHAESDLALSLYGAFSGTTNGMNVQQSPSNAAGGIFELRHISNPLIGWEATYSFNRANQVYTYTGPVPAVCPAPPASCGVTPAAVSANAHELSGDWVPSVHVGNLRPFGLLGVGVLLNEPAGSQSNTTSSNKAVYIYGAGLDWGLLPHIGLRFQYRGNLYKAPDVTTLYTSTNAFTHTAEPMIGAYFSF
jgi:opacity protein-like surface antigen